MGKVAYILLHGRGAMVDTAFGIRSQTKNSVTDQRKSSTFCFTDVVLRWLYLGNHETTRSGLACSGELMDNKTGGIAHFYGQAIPISKNLWTFAFTHVVWQLTSWSPVSDQENNLQSKTEQSKTMFMHIYIYIKTEQT